MSEGWIKLFRQIQSHPMWTKEKFDRARAWIDLLLTAAHKPYDVIRSDQVVHVKRGQILTTQVELAKRWKWDRKTVRRFLVGLERGLMAGLYVPIRGPKGFTIITVTNYSTYQGGEKGGAHLSAHLSPHAVPTQSPRSPHGHSVNDANKGDTGAQEGKECKEGKEVRSMPGKPGTTDELMKERIPDGVKWSAEGGLELEADWRVYLSDYLIRYSNALDVATKTDLGTRLSVEEAQGVIEYMNERLLNDSRLRATEKSNPAKWKQFRAFVRNQFVRALLQKRQRERSYPSKKPPLSPDALGITGQSEHDDFAEEISACVAKYGPDIHKTENLVSVGKRSLTRRCEKQCGFFERKK